MNVGILLGRGVEGCGVTKFALEMHRWYETNGHSSTLHSTSDKTWARKSVHPGSENIKLHRIAKPDQAQKLLRELLKQEVVYVLSLPSVGHPEECVSSFSSLIDSLKQSQVKVVFIQLDHNILSIKRNACLQETVDASNVIFSLSKTNPFVQLINGTKDILSLISSPKYQVHDYQVGYDFDATKAKFWKPKGVQDQLHHKWIGRTTSWKGYKQMFHFHDKYLKPSGYMTTIEGIEKSPAFLDFRKLADFHSHVSEKTPFPCDLSNAYGDNSHVFSVYNNDEMLERMSMVGFGYQLSHLDPEYIDRAIEFTHCEIASVGTVPVFRKSYGDSCHHRVTGDPLTQCKNSGTVWFDDENLASTLEHINELRWDGDKWDDHRHMAFEFYKEHQDGVHVFKEIHETVMENPNA